MEKIDITMTATLRPSLVERTFISIVDKIVRGERDRYRLIINVDKIGENIQQKTVIKIAKKYFNDIIFNLPETPSFPRAVKWVWGNSTSNYIFHIEDDWEIVRFVDVDNMIRLLDKYKKLSSLRLNKYHTPNKKVIKLFDGIWKYCEKDKFYITDDWKKQFGLNPILIKREFINRALPCMVDNVNPEKQFRESQEYMVNVIRVWNYGLYSNPGDPPLVVDIGADWKQKNNFEKPVKSFLTWIKKEG